MGLRVGIDWASKEHAVCILDDAGAVRSRFVVAHSAAGLSELVGADSRASARRIRCRSPWSGPPGC